MRDQAQVFWNRGWKEMLNLNILSVKEIAKQAERKKNEHTNTHWTGINRRDGPPSGGEVCRRDPGQ